MIAKLTEAQAELVETLTKFAEKYEAADHAELVQVVGYALDEIKAPPALTGTLTPKGEAEAKANKDRKPTSPATQVNPVTK